MLTTVVVVDAKYVACGVNDAIFEFWDCICGCCCLIRVNKEDDVFSLLLLIFVEDWLLEEDVVIGSIFHVVVIFDDDDDSFGLQKNDLFNEFDNCLAVDF